MSLYWKSRYVLSSNAREVHIVLVGFSNTFLGIDWARFHEIRFIYVSNYLSFVNTLSRPKSARASAARARHTLQADILAGRRAMKQNSFSKEWALARKVSRFVSFNRVVFLVTLHLICVSHFLTFLHLISESNLVLLWADAYYVPDSVFAAI